MTVAREVREARLASIAPTKISQLRTVPLQNM